MTPHPHPPVPHMTAAHLTRLGPPDVITIGDLPVPQVGSTEVLVEVEAVAVNRVDALIRAGTYPTATPFPFVVGRDLVGTVRLTGPAVEGFWPGDRVWCNSLGHAGRQGSFAEYAAVPQERLYHLPDGVDPTLAVAVAHPAATAYLAWFVHAGLRPGQTVHVGGAAGNVGTAAVQMAARAGARVLASARPADHERCRRAGAELVVDYHAPDLDQQLLDAAPDGVDVCWDTSGTHDLDLAAAVLSPGGRLLLTAGPDSRPRLPVGPLYTKDIGILGFVISRAATTDLAEAATLINDMLVAGQLTTRIAHELPLTDAALAHTLVEEGTVRGRIVLRPRGEGPPGGGGRVGLEPPRA